MPLRFNHYRSSIRQHSTHSIIFRAIGCCDIRTVFFAEKNPSMRKQVRSKITNKGLFLILKNTDFMVSAVPEVMGSILEEFSPGPPVIFAGFIGNFSNSSSFFLFASLTSFITLPYSDLNFTARHKSSLKEIIGFPLEILQRAVY